MNPIEYVTKVAAGVCLTVAGLLCPRPALSLYAVLAGALLIAEPVVAANVAAWLEARRANDPTHTDGE